MVLVDTSVWIDHFRTGETELIRLLKNESVVCHPMIIGELACGSLKNRNEIIGLLHALPSALEARHFEIIKMIESRKLYSKGIGFIDVNLIASSHLSHIDLWTKDKRLKQVADEMNILYAR